MIAILSPAKRLNTAPAPAELPVGPHAFPKDTAALLTVVRRLSAARLAALMDLSDELAALNHGRYQRLTLPLVLGQGDALPAALLFDGEVYRGLDARSLPAQDLIWAQEHLGILSGLFGLLGPLDLAAPYRLEMGTRLANRRGPDLYAFWGDRLAKRLDALLAGHAQRVVVDLASQEYQRAVPRRALKADWVSVQFKEQRGDKLQMIGTFAKQARGRMARFMIQHRVDQVDGLRDFAEDGYAYAPSLSAPDRLVFTRAS